MKNILAVDLGTKCGVAYNTGILWCAETLNLATPKELKAQKKERLDRRIDCRFLRLFYHLSDRHAANKFDIVVFEDVQFASSTYQVQLWSSLRSALWMAFALQPQILIECVPVGTLKKFATGLGSADKDLMSVCLRTQHPLHWTPALDDNAIDATWLWHWANTHLTRAPVGAIIPA